MTKTLYIAANTVSGTNTDTDADTDRMWKRKRNRVFDETLFRIFAKHETREYAPVFREIFASFASFARSNFRDFVFRESYNFRENREIRLTKHNGTCHGS